MMATDAIFDISLDVKSVSVPRAQSREVGHSLRVLTLYVCDGTR